MNTKSKKSKTVDQLTIKDLHLENPRWCAGCGNFGILAALKKLMVDKQLPPHQTVNISGIGCSGRTPFHINTYGVHTIHGRTIPIALGLALSRPELNIFIHSGDGDSMSIGIGHLIHGIRMNFNCVFILYNNEIYALTKKQTSPTTKIGAKTYTQPSGTPFDPLLPVSLAIGVGGSFIASTADWLSDHLTNTLKAAFEHKGFSFVHVVQRCSHYMTDRFDIKDPSWFTFLTHKKGIPPDASLADKAEIIEHDPSNKEAAFEYATSNKRYFGLFYLDPTKPRYDEILQKKILGAKQKPQSVLFDEYKI